MKIQIEYFALLKDQSGLASESVDSTAATPSELYQELAERHSFSLPENALKVAVNEDFANWTDALNDGDTVVFIPPVAGG